MNPDNERLLELARRMAGVYSGDPRVQAITLVGSVARGEADAASDIDMIVFYDKLPTEEELEANRLRLGGSERVMHLRNLNGEGRIGESYYIDGVKHDVAHRHIPSWKAKCADVVERFQVDSPYQKSLEGLFDALPLHGPGNVERWRAELAYPDGLAEAMVRKHLQFKPMWMIQKLGADRDDLLFLYELLVEAERNVMGVLVGLNRIYHYMEYKRADSLLGRMRRVPPGLGPRLRHVLEAPREAAGPLTSIIEETLALVEEHMPQIDTAPVRQRFGRAHGK